MKTIQEMLDSSHELITYNSNYILTYWDDIDQFVSARFLIQGNVISTFFYHYHGDEVFTAVEAFKERSLEH